MARGWMARSSNYTAWFSLAIRRRRLNGAAKKHWHVLVIKVFALGEKKKKQLAEENEVVSDASFAVAVCFNWGARLVSSA